MTRDYIVDLPAAEEMLPIYKLPVANPQVSPSYRVPLPRQLPGGSGTVHRLERDLRAAVFARCDGSNSEMRVLKKAFAFMDLDSNNLISLDEFARALERFGLHTSEARRGIGGLSRAAVQATHLRVRLKRLHKRSCQDNAKLSLQHANLPAHTPSQHMIIHHLPCPRRLSSINTIATAAGASHTRSSRRRSSKAPDAVAGVAV